MSTHDPHRPPVTTRRQDHTPAAAATRPQHGDPPPTDPTGAGIFPPRLAATYQPAELLGTGAEGAVWRVTAGPAELAVKVHWDNQPMDADLIDHLDNPHYHRHVPAIAASGRITTTAGTRDWVAMEYLPRSLEDLLSELRDPDPDTTRAVIAELTRLVTFWQRTIDRNPLDFKPANILIRDTGPWPGQFVIADFGGIHRFTASQAHGGPSHFNLAYAPPEHTWSENASPWPWWGLGEIIHELATGRPRYRRPDGALKGDDEIVRAHIIGDPAADITDERLALLCRGLLTVDPDDRWGAEQVTAWLNGDTPHVAAAPRTTPTLAFGRLELSDPTDIATTLLQRSTDAQRWLTDEGGADKLTTYLNRLHDHDFDTTLLTAINGDPRRAAHALTAFGAHFAPHATPTHRGHPVDTDGLIRLATTDPRHLHDLITDPELLRTLALYRCHHPECRAQPRCDRLQRLTAEAPHLARQALHTAADHDRDHPDTAPPHTEHDAERHHAHALATLAVLTPDTLRTRIHESRASALLGPHWWRRRVLATDTEDTPDGRAAMVTTLLLAGRAETERTHDTPRQTGRDYARSVWHRTLAGLATGLALINATWAGAGSFPGTGDVLASAFPLIVAASTALALWPWRTPHTAVRALTIACWTAAAVFALAYRRTGIHPPDTAEAWWPSPEGLTAFMGLLPEPFRVLPWWLQILLAAAVVLLATKFVALRMRLAYRQRYIHFWDAPRVDDTPEQRAGLAPLAALTWLGLLTTSAAAAAAHHADGHLALAAPPAALLLVFLAAGAALWWLPPRRRLLTWAGTAAATTVLAAGWLTPLRLIEIPLTGALEPVWLALLGLTLTTGAALYLRTRLSPQHIPAA